MEVQDYRKFISSLEPDPGMKNRLREKIFSTGNTTLPARKWIKPAALAAAVSVLVFIVLFGIPWIQPAVPKTSVESASPGTPVFSGFVLTAYAAGDDSDKAVPVELIPNVEVQLQAYSPAMSSVPGLPFKLGVRSPEEGQTAVDELLVSVDGGEIVTWDKETYIVESRGKLYSCLPGDTVYWSPMEQEPPDGWKTAEGIYSALNRNAVLTVTALRNGEKIGSRTVDIKLLDDVKMIYTATLRAE